MSWDEKEPAVTDQDQVRDFARSYTESWCSHDRARVAEHLVRSGTIAINGGRPPRSQEVPRSFGTACPEMQLFMDDVVFKDEAVEFC